ARRRCGAAIAVNRAAAATHDVGPPAATGTAPASISRGPRDASGVGVGSAFPSRSGAPPCSSGRIARLPGIIDAGATAIGKSRSAFDGDPVLASQRILDGDARRIVEWLTVNDELRDVPLPRPVLEIAISRDRVGGDVGQ